MKPLLRKRALIEMKSALDGFLLKQIERADIFPFRSCLSCIYFKEKSELCSKYNMRPPAKIIAYGCPDYDDVDEIPF